MFGGLYKKDEGRGRSGGGLTGSGVRLYGGFVKKSPFPPQRKDFWDRG
jgi:hypothetical protein